jgi:hypothetical protein
VREGEREGAGVSSACRGTRLRRPLMAVWNRRGEEGERAAHQYGIDPLVLTSYQLILDHFSQLDCLVCNTREAACSLPGRAAPAAGHGRSHAGPTKPARAASAAASESSEAVRVTQA